MFNTAMAIRVHKQRTTTMEPAWDLWIKATASSDEFKTRLFKHRVSNPRLTAYLDLNMPLTLPQSCRVSA